MSSLNLREASFHIAPAAKIIIIPPAHKSRAGDFCYFYKQF
ncbi:hypothetical protein DCCM_3653 [Desulfocucumis palustris]|uniref:Uncharacterized protein n=1 Tax=Desulfocucumis palustris TaxID=1898651 RepID=A0A2L2XEU2_9FIRM|nr:hypothetical protein DCCM_3653 [Desulfocucumis palustris]